MLVTTPNLLSASRILAIPALIGAFYLAYPWSNWITLVIFVAAASTDFFDGYLARSLKQQSPLGRWLDPIADKLLVATAIVMLIAFELAPVLPALVIVLREITVSGLREYLAEISVGLPVSRLAKWKTAVQMTAIGFLLVGPAGPSWLPVVEIGVAGLWIAAALTLVTGYDYLRAGLKHMNRAPAGAIPAPNPASPAR